MSPTGHPRIGRTREEREQDAIAAEVDRRERELDDAALSKQILLTPYEQQKLQAEKDALLEALKDTRPRRPADTATPETLDPRVKPAPEPEPVAVVEPEIEVVILDTPLSRAADRQRAAQEALALAQAEAEEADAILAQAEAAHAATLADQQLQRHRAILGTALASGQRQKAAFQALFDQYGGAGRHGTTHGPLARYAKTIPVGDAQRREKLMGLYREAGQLMEAIRLGFSAATKVVETCETALRIGGTGDYAELRLELAQRACEEAAPHDPNVVRAACGALIAAVKAVDGEPGPDVVVYLEGPSRDAVKHQQFAEGLNGPILPQ